MNFKRLLKYLTILEKKKLTGIPINVYPWQNTFSLVIEKVHFIIQNVNLV